MMKKHMKMDTFEKNKNLYGNFKMEIEKCIAFMCKHTKTDKYFQYTKFCKKNVCKSPGHFVDH